VGSFRRFDALDAQFSDRMQYAFRQLGRLGEIGARQEDCEFITAVARDRLACAADPKGEHIGNHA